MSDQSRPLPDRPNLRYLKLEAKRRLAAGEFATLHEAQLAIARARAAELDRAQGAHRRDRFRGSCAHAGGVGDRPLRQGRRPGLDRPDG